MSTQLSRRCEGEGAGGKPCGTGTSGGHLCAGAEMREEPLSRDGDKLTKTMEPTSLQTRGYYVAPGAWMRRCPVRKALARWSLTTPLLHASPCWALGRGRARAGEPLLQEPQPPVSAGPCRPPGHVGCRPPVDPREENPPSPPGTSLCFRCDEHPRLHLGKAWVPGKTQGTRRLRRSSSKA